MRINRVPPGPRQESVWDYPRPPRLEPVARRLRVVFAGRTIADTIEGYRVLETSHPPVYYLPPADINDTLIEPADGTSWCEFKGGAVYWSIAVGDRRSDRAAWSYPEPVERFEAIRDHLAFYASRVDECWVDEIQAEAQQGDFYGGWITPEIVGPFKGPPGTRMW